jgi:hypothetical protein
MQRAGRLLAVAFVGLGFVANAAAQPRRGGGAAPPAERRDPADPTGQVERREQIKKKIRAMRAYLLTEELSLDEPTAARLFPVLSRYDDETDKLLERRVDIQRRLRRASPRNDARAADRAVDRVVDEAIANQREFWELEARRITELRKILMPGQTARLLVVLPELERKIRNQLRKAIVSRRGPSALDDEDDDPQPDESGPRSPPPPKPALRRREGPLAPRSAGSSTPGNTMP